MVLESEVNLNICSMFGFYRAETKLRQWIMLFTEVTAVYHENHTRPIFIIIGEVGLSPWYCGHFWPIVRVETPGDR
jgi:hypothetical protein